MSPLIQIGLPVYNGETFLGEAIESILAQTYGDFELIISDNASTDGTAEICDHFVRRDRRIRYIHQPVNIGAPRNFNYVFQKATSPYFKWAGANDICDPLLLQACKAILDEKPDVVLCFAKTAFIDAKGTVFKFHEDNALVEQASAKERFLYLVDNLCYNNAHAGLFRSEALRKTGLEGSYPSSDLVMIAELSLQGKFHEVQKPLFFRRVIAGAATPCYTLAQIHEQYYPGTRLRYSWALWRRSLGYLAAVARSPISYAEKMSLFLAVLRRMYWNRNSLRKELVDNLSRRSVREQARQRNSVLSVVVPEPSR